MKELAAEFVVHRNTVVAHLERAGTPRPPTVAKLNDEDVRVASHSTTLVECLRSSAISSTSTLEGFGHLRQRLFWLLSDYL